MCSALKLESAGVVFYHDSEVNKMKQTILICLFFLSAVLVSCANENNSDPSIKKDYQEKYDFVMATLSTTLRNASVSSAEADFLISKITELKNLVPLSGLSEDVTLDNLDTLDWNIKGQPAIRLKRFSSWVICQTPKSLEYANLKVESSVSDEYVKVIAPRMPNAHVSAGSTFDYDKAKAQYAVDISDVVLYPRTIAVDLGIHPSESCSGPRNVLTFKVYSKTTLSAIARWTESLDSALADIQVLKGGRSGNYPDSYIVEKARQKIRAAFSALP